MNYLFNRTNKLSPLIFLCFFCIVFVLSSCSSDKSKNKDTLKTLTVTEIRKLEKIMPKDTILKEKYKRSCFLCHTNPEAKAHLVHYKEEWGVLIEAKGLDSLVKNVSTGYNAMPPKGQCGDCTEEELRSLIKFLANRE